MTRQAFDPERLRPLLIQLNGDVAQLADDMRVDSEELRAFIRKTPMLMRAMDEILARGVDMSLTVLFAGLKDEHYVNRLGAAKVFLKSRAAARRGFAAPHAELEISARPTGSLTLTWLPPQEEGPTRPEPKLIEGKVNDPAT